MLKPTEAGAVVEFLDRVTITGHKERQVMNRLVDILTLMQNPKAPEVDKSIVKVPMGKTDDQ